MTRILKSALTIAGISLVFVNCTPHLDQLEVHESFVTSNINGGGMVIGDIVISDTLESQYAKERVSGRKSNSIGAPGLSRSEFAKLSKQEQNSYALRFARKAKERDPGWIISTTHMNRFNYNQEEMNGINQKIASLNGVSAPEMQLMAKKIKQAEDRSARYFVSMRLEGDQSWNTDDSEIAEEKSAEGKVKSYKRDTFSSCRQIDCRMQVFDLFMKQVVFDGLSNEKSCASKTVEEPLHRRALIVINNHNRGGQYYPQFPSRRSILESCQDRFAGNFPEADD